MDGNHVQFPLMVTLKQKANEPQAGIDGGINPGW